MHKFAGGDRLVCNLEISLIDPLLYKNIPCTCLLLGGTKKNQYFQNRRLLTSQYLPIMAGLINQYSVNTKMFGALESIRAWGEDFSIENTSQMSQIKLSVSH